MPYGKGTYGSKRGRPPKKAKKKTKRKKKQEKHAKIWKKVIKESCYL